MSGPAIEASDLASQFLAENWFRTLQTYIELEPVLRSTATTLLMAESKTIRMYGDDTIVECEWIGEVKRS